MATDDRALDEIRSLAQPLGATEDLDPLLARIGDARCVLIGEASHGTSEYYRWRAELTRRLIAEEGFSFVAVEGDWPDCVAVNRWVKGDGQEPDAAAVLERFSRWPTWMWANTDVARFLDWLRAHNATDGADVGFYGLDVYSLWDSLAEVRRYLAEHHPDSVTAAEEAWRCFEPYGEEPQRYAWSTRMVPEGCEREVVELLGEVRRRTTADGADADLDARQNAEALRGAERYYRTMVRADSSSWNVRDHHMADTLDRLLDHHGSGSRAVVWEHNTHVGDARATDMAAAGMVNVGQLVRERYGEEDTVLVGFSGAHGSVIAGESWGATPERMPVPEPPGGTHEDLLRRAVDGSHLFVFPEDRSGPWLSRSRGHRAIGVVYRPQRDHLGNWIPTVMGGRYDALISLDETTALTPLHPGTAQPEGEKDTFPWSA